MAGLSARLERFKDSKILRSTDLHPHVVQTYWQTLYMHDLLKHRLCDVKDPTWSDALRMIVSHGQYIFYTVRDEVIISEFTLEPIAGRAALTHFSFSPALSTRDKVYLGMLQCYVILKDWKLCDTLIGLTPECNEPAIKLAFASGFKYVTRIPSGQAFDGQTVDAIMTQLTAGDLNGRR